MPPIFALQAFASDSSRAAVATMDQTSKNTFQLHTHTHTHTPALSLCLSLLCSPHTCPLRRCKCAHNLLARTYRNRYYIFTRFGLFINFAYRVFRRIYNKLPPRLSLSLSLSVVCAVKRSERGRETARTKEWEALSASASETAHARSKAS